MTMLFNQLLDLPYLSGAWVILAKEKCSLTGIFVYMEHFWYLLFQLMKHGTNALHVTFIFLLSVHVLNTRVLQVFSTEKLTVIIVVQHMFFMPVL